MIGRAFKFLVGSSDPINVHDSEETRSYREIFSGEPSLPRSGSSTPTRLRGHTPEPNQSYQHTPHYEEGFPALPTTPSPTSGGIKPASASSQLHTSRVDNPTSHVSAKTCARALDEQGDRSNSSSHLRQELEMFVEDYGVQVDSLEREVVSLRLANRNLTSDVSNLDGKLKTAITSEQKGNTSSRRLRHAEVARREAEAQVTHLTGELEESRVQVSWWKGRIRDLERQYEQEEGKRRDAEKSLAEARAFVAIDDVGDIGRVIQALNDINDVVDDIAFSLYSAIPEDVLCQPVSRNLEAFIYERAAVGFPVGHLLLEHARRIRCQALILDDLLLRLFKSLIYEDLNHLIFARFHPLLTYPGIDSFFTSLYSSIANEETQPRASRWRSMSFASISRAGADHPSSLTQRCTNSVGSSLNQAAFHSGAHFLDDETVLKPLAQQLAKLVDEALAWQRLKQGYISCDFEILFQNVFDQQGKNLTFDGETMKVGGGEPSSSEGVVVATSFGLVQLKTKVNSDGGKARVRVVLEKAEVLTDRWLRD